jgi:hypothetical protein
MPATGLIAPAGTEGAVATGARGTESRTHRSSPMTKFFCLSFALVLVAFATHPASADQTIQSTGPAPLERTNSINANPLAIIWGDYGGNYEHLFGGRHGLLVEAAFSSGGNDEASYTSYGGALGYRFHWSGSQDSGFLGLNVGFGVGTGASTVANSAGQPMTYDLSIRTLYATMDVGKRWQFDSGLNVTFRLGAGRALRTVSTTSNAPDAQKAAQDLQDVLAWLPVTLDGELSLGYSF